MIIIMSWFCESFAMAQDSDTLTLKDLDIPNAPGFILLDNTPTSIEKPNTSKAFVISALNSFSSNGGIPQNYAVEFTPFWFFKHPNMTSLIYMGYKHNRQSLFHNIQKAAVSFAFINSQDSVTEQHIANFSLGVRTNLLTVRSKKDIDDLKTANTKVVAYLKSLDVRLTNAGIIFNPAEETQEQYNKRVEEFLKSEESEKTDDKNDLRAILQRNPVLGIDGALGYNSFFPDNNYANHHFGRFGAWVTLTFSKDLEVNNVGNNYFNFYLVGRYLSDGTEKINDQYTRQDLYDVGGKIEFEFKKLTFSYEYIYRTGDIPNTFRSNGLLKYKVSDTVVLTGAYGKNFGTENNLISLLGINWGFTAGNEKAVLSQ